MNRKKKQRRRRRTKENEFHPRFRMFTRKKMHIDNWLRVIWKRS
jgi:hypothetical protein